VSHFSVEWAKFHSLHGAIDKPATRRYYLFVLSELERVPQEQRRSGYRRWFSDDELDLIVWYSDSGEVSGFQLCYDLKGLERAFTWREGAGLMHTAVDTGDDSPLHNHSPILVSCPVVSLEKVIAEFGARSQTLDPPIATFILSKISGFKAKR
jgi:hypothetical protein